MYAYVFVRGDAKCKKKNERIEIQGRVDVSLCNSKSCQPKRMYAFLTNTTTTTYIPKQKRKIMKKTIPLIHE
jgi:hypothetical protein